MKKKLTMWVIGGIMTASAMVLGFNATVGSAAEKEAVHAMHGDMVMQGENKVGTMDHSDMGDMMKNGDMQKHCMEMMKNPEMQANMQSMMKEMMKDPEMRLMMKEMMKSPEMQSLMQEIMQENK